jgi:hypothetical protein
MRRGLGVRLRLCMRARNLGTQACLPSPMHTQTQFHNLQALVEPESYNAAAIAREELREAGRLTPFLEQLLANMERGLDSLHSQIAPLVEEILELERELYTAS